MNWIPEIRAQEANIFLLAKKLAQLVANNLEKLFHVSNIGPKNFLQQIFPMEGKAMIHTACLIVMYSLESRSSKINHFDSLVYFRQSLPAVPIRRQSIFAQLLSGLQSMQS